MASLGEMAGGVAHEINNPLAIINGYAYRLSLMAEKNALAPEEVLMLTERMARTVGRISGIVKGLRAFCRDGSQDPFDRVGVHGIIAQTLDLVKARLAEGGIDVTVEPIPQGLAAQCREVEISQVLLNLLQNAFDAVTELSDKWIRIETHDLGYHVRISVIDSGSGVPPHVREKMMHPFFTTKEVGKGTGLGLSISRGIIDRHGGELGLDTASPNTRFFFTLPKAEQPALSRETKAATQGRIG